MSRLILSPVPLDWFGGVCMIGAWSAEGGFKYGGRRPRNPPQQRSLPLRRPSSPLPFPSPTVSTTSQPPNMASYAPSVLFALLSATTAAAQGLTWAPTPLVDQHFPTPSDAPYKVWPDEPAYERGPQTGYNQCNSTTEGQNSLCQTMYFNGLDGM